MATAFLKRAMAGPFPVMVLILLVMGALFLVGTATENTVESRRLYSWLLLINLVALVLLISLIVVQFQRLVQQYRKRVIGSRMAMRLVAMFVMLSLAPAAVVYYFSLQFLHRGIDSWFDVRIESALDDAMELSRTALDLRMRELMRQLEDMAPGLSDVGGELAAVKLNQLRAESGATELSLFTQSGLMVAASSADPTMTVPLPPEEHVIEQLRQGDGQYVGLDVVRDLGLHARVAVHVPFTPPGSESRVLQGLFPISGRMATLADSVQAAHSQYRELSYLRGSLKFSFTVTLTLVLLLSLLTAIWAAFFSARRLTAPIRDLAEGTRAVAAGDFNKRLPLPIDDELGLLVRSFNDMTRRLAQARDHAQNSQRALEDQRAYLEAVLKRLSSGVLTIDHEGVLRTANSAAGQILGLRFEEWIGRGMPELVQAHSYLQPLAEALTGAGTEGDWREEIILFGAAGRQVLLCRGAVLFGTAQMPVEQVVVFDDVTALVQAQRDAAWGEVARRLAHEIKNPLTPIQLAAERMQHRFLPKMEGKDAQLLERSTHTIVQQVVALKEMVNAFTDYARSAQMQRAPLNLNDLVDEVLDLYRGARMQMKIAAELDPELPHIRADSGRLRQLLHNLVKNSVEAMERRENAQLRVRTRCMDDGGHPFIELRVEDNGPGFPRDLIGQIFEPYVTTKAKGSGLGLAIVKKIVEEHNGIIWAENQPEGGASVIILFPVLEAGQALTGASARPDSAPTNSRRRAG